MANVKVTWDAKSFTDKTRKAATDGLEEFAKGVWQPQAQTDCPVSSGTMRGSLGTERDDVNSVIYVGGGGAASSYILKQELDRSIRHNVGKAGFIKDSLDMHSGEIAEYVKKHIG